MKTRMLLCGLAVLGALLVASGTASAAVISPTGPVTATATSWKLVWPAHGTQKESSISCSSATIKGTVKAPENGSNVITGTELPTTSGCQITAYWAGSPFNGTATMTGITKPYIGFTTTPTSWSAQVTSYSFHVKTYQPFGLECEFGFSTVLRTSTTTGTSPFTVAELHLTQPSVSVGTTQTGECKTRYAEVAPSFSGTFKFDHALTVS